MHTENAALRAEFVGLMTRFQGLMVQAMADGQASSVLRADLAPQDGAILLMSLVHGLAIRWSLGQHAFALEVGGGHLLACQLALFQTIKETA